MKDCDPKKPSKFIIQLDMNNLLGWAMSEYLPHERFKWLKHVDGFDLMSIDKIKVRYDLFLRLILNTPKNCMHRTMIILYFQKKLLVSYEMLSDYCKKIAKK